MHRKLVIVCLVLSLLVSFALPMTLSAAVNGEFTFEQYSSWIGGAPTPDSPVTKYIGDKTGVYFKELRYPSGAEGGQKLTMEMASNSLPDFISFDGSWTQLISEKKVIALDKYFNDPKNYPSLSKMDKDTVNLFREADGHIYKIPIQHGSVKNVPATNVFWNGAGWWVRVDVLKKAGMKVSNLATLAGVERFLAKAITLKNDQGQNYLGLAWDPLSSWAEQLDGLFGIQTYNPTANAMNPDWSTPGYKNLVTWLNKLYRTDLLDQEAPTQTSDAFRGKVTSNRYAFIQGHGGTIPELSNPVLKAKFGDDYTNHVVEDWVAVPTPKIPNVKTKPFAFISVAGWGGKGIATTCKNPDKLMKFIDYCYSTEGQLIGLYGILGNGLKQQKDGSYIVDKPYTDAFFANPWAILNSGKSDLWFWSWNCGLNWVPRGAKFEGHPFIFTSDSYQPATRRKTAYAVMLFLKEKTMTLQQAWQVYPQRASGANDKYAATITDTRNKYFAKLIMAASADQVDSLFKDLQAEMENRGHASEVLQQQLEDYKAYLKTPAGMTMSKIKMPSKFVADSWNLTDPVEKNIPGVYYGDLSEYLLPVGN